MADEQRIRNAHQPGGRTTFNGAQADYDICRACDSPMPCDALAALDALTASRAATAKAESRVDQQAARVRELEAALAFYADPSIFECTPWAEGLHGLSRMDDDMGKRARAALSSTAASGDGLATGE